MTKSSWEKNAIDEYKKEGTDGVIDQKMLRDREIAFEKKMELQIANLEKLSKKNIQSDEFDWESDKKERSISKKLAEKFVEETVKVEKYKKAQYKKHGFVYNAEDADEGPDLEEDEEEKISKQKLSDEFHLFQI